MKRLKKICFVTGSRAEYGLLKLIMKNLLQKSQIKLQIIVTGMHLSPEFGNTWEIISEEGFTINRKVEMLLSSDTALGVAMSTGIGIVGISTALNDLAPDLLVVLGDRFEIFSAASSAALMGIPVAHIHGGEATEGAVDDSLRHAITKLSHLHFVSTEFYRKRVIQMGEHPDRVFCFGSPGVDAISALNLMPLKMLEKTIGFNLGERYLLVTFHPVTLGVNSSSSDVDELIAALDTLPSEIKILITMPNSDASGRIISTKIRQYATMHPDRIIAITNLGQLLYLSAMQHCLAVVGNSSSGIIEAPSLGVGTVNIGDRQKGRIQANSVINCPPQRDEISKALARAITDEFQLAAATVDNPYGTGGASNKIANKLATFSLNKIMQKTFYDIN